VDERTVKLDIVESDQQAPMKETDKEIGNLSQQPDSQLVGPDISKAGVLLWSHGPQAEATSSWNSEIGENSLANGKGVNLDATKERAGITGERGYLFQVKKQELCINNFTQWNSTVTMLKLASRSHIVVHNQTCSSGRCEELERPQAAEHLVQVSLQYGTYPVQSKLPVFRVEKSHSKCSLKSVVLTRVRSIRRLSSRREAHRCDEHTQALDADLRDQMYSAGRCTAVAMSGSCFALCPEQCVLSDSELTACISPQSSLGSEEEEDSFRPPTPPLEVGPVGVSNRCWPSISF
jgi:hypothetical protein